MKHAFRIIMAFVLLAAISLFGASAGLAGNAEPVTTKAMHGIPAKSGKTADEAAAQFISRVMSGEETAGGMRGAAGYAALGEREKRLYDQLKPLITGTANGKRTSTEFAVPLSSVFETDTFLYNEVGEGLTELPEDWLPKLLDVPMVMDALLADCPYDLYWFDKEAGYGYYIPTGYYPHYPSDDSFQLADYDTEGTINVLLYVGSEYALNGDPLACDPAWGTAANNAAETARSIVATNASLGDEAKLAAYKEAICELTDYNHAAAEDNSTPYGNPWQMIWVFDGDASTNVVCEGYSKAFQYLCDESSFQSSKIKSIIVSGIMSGGTGAGGHMWNVVTLADGKKYLVDVTNSDAGSIGSGGGLFLARSSATSAYTNDGETYTMYVFPAGGGNVLYGYDANTIRLYGDSELDILDVWITISFDPGRGTGEMESLHVNTGEEFPVPVCEFTYQNGSFVHWVTGSQIISGETMTAEEDITLTAVWDDNRSRAVVLSYYDYAQGNWKEQVYYPLYYGDPFVFPEPLGGLPEHYTFRHWQGGSAAYLPGDYFSVDENYTFSGVWLKSPGAGISWSVSDNGVLNISGQGILNACEGSDNMYGGIFMPWYTETGITSVVIGEGITGIGHSAFSNYPHITAVNLPDSLVSIGSRSFAGCTSLSEISFPHGLKTIGDYAFSGCHDLGEGTINLQSTTVTHIGSNAFYGCEPNWLQLPVTLEEIGENVTDQDGGCQIYYTGSPSQWAKISIHPDNPVIFSPSFPIQYGLQDAVAFSLSPNPLILAAGSTGALEVTGISPAGAYCMPAWTSSDETIAVVDDTGLVTAAAVGTAEISASFNGCTAAAEVIVSCNHQLEMHEQDDPSCTEPGTEAWWQCTVCGRLFSDAAAQEEIPAPVELPAAGHDLIPHEAKAATCTEIGWDAYDTCSRCDYTTYAEIAASGHTPVVDPAVAPTATETGLTEGSHCAVCGEILVPQEVVPVIPGPGLIASGTWGSLTWTLDENGLLTISGSGDMDALEYASDSTDAWKPYTADIQAIVIENGVTSIGDRAFEASVNLQSVTIAGSVTGIGEEAFYDCSSLSSVTIPDSVTRIGDRAFWICSSLPSVTIPDSVTSIGMNPFGYCDSLESIHVDPDNPIYESADGVLIDKSGGELIAYPSGKFDDSYTIPAGVTSIGSNAFDNSFLSEISIPSGMVSIGDYAFNCVYLRVITISDTVTDIGEEAFYNPRMERIDVDPNNPVFSSDDGILFNQPKTTLIKYPANKACSSYTIPDTVTRIEGGAFSSCKIQDIFMPDSVTEIEDSAFAESQYLETIRISNNLTRIGLGAFDCCECLTAVELPDSVTSIGNVAFRSCSSLTSINLPESITSIGGSVFIGCGRVTVTVAADSYGLQYCIDNEIPYVIAEPEASPFTISDGMITGYNPETPVSDLVIPGTISGQTVTGIGYGVFEYRSELTSVTIPDTVTVIDTWSFYGCSGLTGITIPESVTTIGGWAFCHCSSLTEVTIPKNVTDIGDYAFAGAFSLTGYHVDPENTAFSDVDGVLFDKQQNVILSYPYAKEGFAYAIPDTVTRIGNGAFAQCINLSDISIPDGVTGIGEFAFEDCNGLTRITIPDSVESIGYAAFIRCFNLKSVTIPENTASIGRIAFSGCDSLTGVTICHPDAAIAGDAFAECPALTLRGWAGSTTQAYAEDHDIPFVPIPESGMPVLTVSVNDTSYDYADIAELTAEITWPDGSTEGLEEAYPDAYIHATLVTENGEAVPGFIVQGGYGFELSCDFPLADDEMEPGYYKILVETNVENLTAETDVFYYTADKSHLPDPSECQIELEISTTEFRLYERFVLSATVTDKEGNPVGGMKVGFQVLDENGEITGFYNGYAYIWNTTDPGTGACGLASTKSAALVSSFPPGRYIARAFIVGSDPETADEKPFSFSLNELVLPDGIGEIEEEAFANTGFEMVTIPEGCESIGEYAFRDCANLIYVRIPASVADVPENAFEGCNAHLFIHRLTE